MIGIAIDFEWTQFPKYVFKESPPPRPGATRLEVQVIRLNGVGSPRTTRPLDRFPALYLQLEKADPSQSGHLEFAKKFGLLTDRASEDFTNWPEAIKRMKRLIEITKGRDGWYEPFEVSRHFTLRFQPSGTDEMKLSVAPANLQAALTLQCLTNRVAGARTHSCKACGEVFEVGGASGNRSHKEFCSDKCRFNFNNRKKSAGQ